MGTNQFGFTFNARVLDFVYGTFSQLWEAYVLFYLTVLKRFEPVAFLFFLSTCLEYISQEIQSRIPRTHALTNLVTLFVLFCFQIKVIVFSGCC